MPARSTLETLLLELARLLQPLADAAGATQPEGLEALAWQAGLDLEAMVAEPKTLGAIASDLATAYQALAPLAEDPAGADLSQLGGLLDAAVAVAAALESLGALKARPGSAVAPAVLADALLGALVAEDLELNHPTLYLLLVVLGVIRQHVVDARYFVSMRLSDLVRLAREPEALLAEAYGWGGSSFLGLRLLVNVNRLLNALGVPSTLERPLAQDLKALGSDPAEAGVPVQLRAPLLLVGDDTGVAEAGVAALAVGAKDAHPPGLAATLFGTAGIDERTELGAGLALTFHASADSTLPAALVVRPDGVSVEMLGKGAPTLIGLRATLERDVATGRRVVLVGSAEGARFEAGSAGIMLDMLAQLQSGGPVSGQLDAGLHVRDARLVLPPPAGDGFLKTLLGGGLTVGFDLQLAWSTAAGLHFKGGSGLEVTLPQHLAAGPVRVEAVHLKLAPGDVAMDYAAGASLSARLGPVTATADDLRVEGSVRFPQGLDGNLGFIDFPAPTVQPPRGVGLVVDTAAVTGGGYLFFDAEHHRYAGALQLTIEENISVAAVGLLSTRLPDGRDGFSLLVLIDGRFPPVELGFGFTLNGVGGLIGINRGVAVEALRAGLRAGAANEVLFPKDPVADAPRLIRDLERFFPVARDQFVVGPTVLIEWGSPDPVLNAELAVLVELPAPVRLVLLGELSAMLPSPSKALLELHVDVLGSLDFDRRTVAIDAVLRDSHVAGFNLTGAFALRADFGDRPAFALSAGGFNPRFHPPAGFPRLERVAIALSSGDNPRLRLESYFALTSNTVQFGARLEAYASVTIAGVKFSAEGTLGFDALFDFDPFHFQVDMDGRVTIKQGDTKLLVAALALSLSGPAPWHAWGAASFEVFLIGSVKIPFDVRIGHTPPQPGPVAVDAEKRLRALLADPRSWSGARARDVPVSVKPAKVADGTILVQPAGRLTFQQHALPLDTPLDHLGHSPVTGARELSITAIHLGTAGPLTPDPVEDFFARAQFQELSESEKLSAPSFERLTAGATLGPDAAAPVLGAARDVALEYETLVLGQDGQATAGPLHAPAWRDVRRWAGFGARSWATARAPGSARFQPPAAPPTVRLEPIRYVVTSVDSLEPADGAAATSYSAARGALSRLQQERPGLRGRLQLTPAQRLKESVP